MTELHPSQVTAEHTEDVIEADESEKATVADVMELINNHKPDAIITAAKVLSELPAPVRLEGEQTVLLSDEARVRIHLGKTTLKDEIVR